jgi:hypothetical protein
VGRQLVFTPGQMDLKLLTGWTSFCKLFLASGLTPELEFSSTVHDNKPVRNTLQGTLIF